MRISQLQAWFDEQKAAHGDVEVVCMTAPCHDPMGQILSSAELRVSTPSMLGMSADGIGEEDTVLAIGFGNDHDF